MTTRRDAIKGIAAMAASCALPASAMTSGQNARTAQLACRLYRATLYWACSWFEPRTSPVELLMPKKITDDAGCTIHDVATELRRYCPNATITPTDKEELDIVYVVDGHKVKARFFSPYCLV